MLNDAQRQAVDHDSGPLIVLAGPGTGKTRVIVSRIQRLVEGGADPESILGLTFSTKAAGEMRSRVAEVVDPRVAERLRIWTFHSFGQRVLERFGDMIGLRRERTLMDSAQTKRLLRRLVREHDLFSHYAAAGTEGLLEDAAKFIGQCRNAARTPADALRYASEWGKRLDAPKPGVSADELTAERALQTDFLHRARLFNLYDRACFEEGLITFDDLLTLPLRLFDEKPVSIAILRSEIRHVLVDEFQDVNRAQIELLKRLAPRRDDAGRAPDLCVVGDDDQSIYGFRGSDSRAFPEFQEAWPDYNLVALTRNHRNARAVAAVANAIISGCAKRVVPDKVIEPVGPDGTGAEKGSVEGVIVPDADAPSAAAALIQLARAHDASLRWSNFAVLANSNNVVDTVAETLELNDIPAAVRGRLTPLDDPGVQDLNAWIEVLTASDPQVAVIYFQRLLTRPPFFVEPARAMDWSLAYRRERSLAPEGDTLSFLDWLRERHANDPAVARLIATADDLFRAALTRTADETVHEIIRRTDLVHAEDLEPRARAARVAHLVQVLRFVRSRQPHLDPPGNLASWRAYYADLNKDEQEFVAPGEEAIEGTGLDGADPDRDAVQVLTAHKAKGLEFRQVILLRCRPKGFPNHREADRKKDEALVPPEFLGTQRDPETEEQRRLFYVACTRAMDRLVLLANPKKSKGDAIDYFIELTEDTPGLAVPVLDGPDLIDRAGVVPRDELANPDSSDGASSQKDELIDREASLVRQSAYAALHDASAPRLDPEALASIGQRLADSAGALHALERLRATGNAPSDVPAPFAERIARVASRIARSADPIRYTKPLVGPLELSFSKIKDFGMCPRCYYAKYVMRIDEARTASLDLGSMVHAVLERFFDEWRRADADGAPRPGVPRIEALSNEIVRREWPRSEPFDPEALRRVIAQARFAFEALHANTDQVLHVEQLVRFPWPDAAGGPAHRFTAKIDRVDQLPDGSFRIVDYKTVHSTKALASPPKDDLQMCIYALALDALLDGRTTDGDAPAIPDRSTLPGTAEYWLLSTGERGVIEFTALRLEKARKKIDEAIKKMLAGEFPRSKDCTKRLCDLVPDDE